MKFKIMCAQGDSAYEYDEKMAEVKFDELKGSGMLPVVIDDGGRRVLSKFEDVDVITWMPGVMGG